MYFLHLELTFTPHYIITDKGLLNQSFSATQCLRRYNVQLIKFKQDLQEIQDFKLTCCVPSALRFLAAGKVRDMGPWTEVQTGLGRGDSCVNER